MSSRGPEGKGEWYSEEGRIALGHRRLAVIDLSEKAAQPMAGYDGTLVLSFNGEIYNSPELRSRLEKKSCLFHSHSDTEVLLHLYSQKGQEMIRDLRGMFAFVLWDARKEELLLARDPYGIKPLYYSDDGRTIRAASQVKALLAGGKVSKKQDPAGVTGFFLTGSVPEPHTLYEEIRAVPAGTFLYVNRKGASQPQPYFSMAEIFTKAERNPSRLRPLEQEEMIRAALADSVKHHLVSDRPLGIFLSGGKDSGTVVALASESKAEPLQTVTLAFEEFRGQDQDEAPWAEATARIYGTNHHTHRLSFGEFKKDLPRIFKAMDQPTLDGINTYSVSKIAAEWGLKVALSGLGGDELFGGYPSFRKIPRMVEALSVPSRLPFAGNLFKSLHGIFGGLTNPKLSGLLKYGGTYPGAYFLRRGLFLPWELSSVMKKETALEGLRRLTLIESIQKTIRPEPQNPFSRVAVLESSLYLRNQLLRDADWAGMAHSLEIRTPFVDSALLRKLAPALLAEPRIPGKALLIGAPRRSLPDALRRRRKTGFATPLPRWLETAKEFEGWRRLPLLKKSNCPWARRWAYLVFNQYVAGVQ